ncbi:MAG: ATP-binding cassette domain-containing protein [Acidimicrobiia bacterium]
MSDGFLFEHLRFPSDGSVLGDVTINVAGTERVAMFGPNGAGKTTALRAMAGLLDGGTIDPAIAYLPQTPFAFRGSVRMNLLLGRSEDSSLAIDLLGGFGLGSALDAEAGVLSGGELKRVALARTLAGSEPLVLLDEPLAAIDGVDRAAAIEAIRDRTSGRALVCVTHSVENASALCETLVVLDKGSVLQTGGVHEVLSLPASDRVAEIAGIRNVINGQIVSRSANVATVAAGSTQFIVVTDAEVGTDVVISIGAETIAVYAEPPGVSSMRNVVEGRIAAIEQRGRLREVTLTGEPGLAALLTPGALDALGIGVGSSAWFGVKTAAIRVVRS